MKLIKVKKSGQLRVDMDMEEFGYLYALAARCGYPACEKIYPPVKKYHKTLENSIINYAHNIVYDAMSTIAESVKFEGDPEESHEYSVRKYRE